MVKVPGIIEAVFTKFPLYSYNEKFVPICSEQEDYFYFESEKPSEERSKFRLGVSNIIKVQVGSQFKSIPSDPFSLCTALILCQKNDLKLPSDGGKNKSNNCIMKMSLYGSPDSQLPILIEDENDNRLVRTHSNLIRSMEGPVKENEEYFLINKMIDRKLHDLWILCLLVEELKEEEIFSIFNVGEQISSNKFSRQYERHLIVSTLPGWDSFKIRKPHLFGNAPIFSGGLLKSISSNIDVQSLRKEYEYELDLFEEELKVWILLLEKFPDTKTFIKTKISSFVIIIDLILRNTKIGHIIQKNKYIIDYSYRTLAAF